ncbi:RagB/SusD family nutrient uptake outer membrane protein [Mucilaginibacter arboris]|uniref:RagB/SusD family nutrient uptake outer membrane protein n=1 Tax=Mucilaginibacter arboris TaxID=2682090 RepID=A0A7K1SZH1_9SPHI|nr:RagB/SusD family nutrient uptake outer membrane protein [Mucilaginibacter arboris]MVN22709.1 RagB/SusD family nutrient uptake outer membrane protein [Mucilaginibacter arboris]
MRKLIRIKGKLAVLILIMLFSCSCNKYLDLKPQDGIIKDEFWKTKEQLQAAVIGCYASLLGSATGNGTGNDRPLADVLFVWGEARADMVGGGPGVTVDEVGILSDNILSSNSFTNWAPVYKIINYCNTVLDNGPGVMQYDKTLTQTQLNAYLSEALALRALMYFYLVRSFGDVPLKLKSTASDTDLQQLTKTSQKDVLAQILTDLKQAESNAVFSYGDNASNKGRITKYTIYTMEADVYLWMDDYNDCITACDKVINSGQYGLVAGTGGWFNTLYYNGNSSEGIFEFQFDSQKLNPFYAMFLTNKARYVSGATVMDDFFGIDFNDATDYDIRGSGASVNTNDNNIFKYVAATSTTYRTTDVSYAHWFVYRYADVLLMKAEACINVNRGQDALTLINQIRTRAHAIYLTAQNPNVTDVNGMTDYLLAERGREFAFEGKRWYDLLRNAKRNNYARIDILLSAAISSAPPTSQQAILNKLKDVNSHYFPIYYNEIRVDPNLVQNPFYQ